MSAVIALPITVGRETAAAMLEISLRTFQTRVAEGVLPKPRMLGGCARWLVTELQAAAEKLPISDLLPPPVGDNGG